MKRFSHLLYSSILILISLTYCSCRSTSFQTKTIGIEAKQADAKKEETEVKKEVSVVKKEEKAAEPSSTKVETSHEKESSSTETPKTVGKTFNGGASYYADHFHGKKTASGELYHKEQYTAAIRMNALPFPFGTLVEVTSIKNGKSVVVRVNDKMSDKAKGIIDLSYEAAKAIGLILDGRTEVTIRAVSEEEK